MHLISQGVNLKSKLTGQTKNKLEKRGEEEEKFHVKSQFRQDINVKCEQDKN